MIRKYKYNIVFYSLLAIVVMMMVLSFVSLNHKIALWIELYALNISSLNMMWALAVFLIAALAFDIVLPIPTSVVAVVSATTFGFSVGAGIIWLGLMLGCCSGYFIGSRSADFVFRRFTNQKTVLKEKSLPHRVGPWALTVLRGVPVLAETSVIAAGMVRYHFPSFLVICGLSNAGLAMAYGYIGAQASVTNSFLLVGVGCIAIPGAAWVINRLVHSLKGPQLT